MSTEQNLQSRTTISKSQRKRWMFHLATIFIIVALLWFFYWFFIARFYVYTDDAYVRGNLIQVMPQIPGHVTAIFADETDLVTKGQPIITLDKADAVLALEKAEYQLAITVRQVSQLYNSVKQLQSDVQLQQDKYEKSQQDYQRRQGLIANKTISVEDLQHAKLAMETAAQALNVAKHQLESTLALVGNTDLYHHPKILVAEGELTYVYLNWLRTTIYAPETGIVAKREVQVGEQVSPGTVLMIIVPLNQVWVDANYKETELRNIRIDQPAEITADIYGSQVKYHGKVVGLNPGTGSAFELLPPQNATGNWIKIVQRLPVRINLDPEQLKEHPLQVGLSLSVYIDTHDRNGSALKPYQSDKIIYQSTNYNAQFKNVYPLIDKILQTNAKNIEPVSP